MRSRGPSGLQNRNLEEWCQYYPRENSRGAAAGVSRPDRGAELVAASVAGQDARYITHVQTWSERQVMLEDPQPAAAGPGR